MSALRNLERLHTGKTKFGWTFYNEAGYQYWLLCVFLSQTNSAIGVTLENRKYANLKTRHEAEVDLYQRCLKRIRRS